MRYRLSLFKKLLKTPGLTWLDKLVITIAMACYPALAHDYVKWVDWEENPMK